MGSKSRRPQHREDRLREFPTKRIICVPTPLHCFAISIAWDNSRHFVKPPLVSPWNDVWQTTAEIPYWWRVITQIWVVLSIGPAAWEFASTNQKHYSDLRSDASSVWNFCAPVSDVISRRYQRWRLEMWAVFSGYARENRWPLQTGFTTKGTKLSWNCFPVVASHRFIFVIYSCTVTVNSKMAIV